MRELTEKEISAISGGGLAGSLAMGLAGGWAAAVTGFGIGSVIGGPFGGIAGAGGVTFVCNLSAKSVLR